MSDPLCVTQIPVWKPLAADKNLSRLMGKPTICIGENKDADQLRGNREADQRLCFRYSDSTIPLLLKSEISSFQLFSVLVQAGLCRTCSETTLLVFPRGGSFTVESYHTSISSLLSLTDAILVGCSLTSGKHVPVINPLTRFLYRKTGVYRGTQFLFPIIDCGYTLEPPH